MLGNRVQSGRNDILRILLYYYIELKTEHYLFGKGVGELS
jgi:hypothetical protein